VTATAIGVKSLRAHGGRVPVVEGVKHSLAFACFRVSTPEIVTGRPSQGERKGCARKSDEIEVVLADPGAEGEERALGKLRAAVAPALA